MTTPLDEYRARLRTAMDRMTELRDALAAERSARREPIAVIGLGGRFPPGLGDPDELFDALLRGEDATRDPPAARFPAPAEGLGRAGWLRDVRGFDAAFFAISPREAAAMDPQQRLLLECTWEALERAGQPAERLTGARVGVFVGLGACDYLDLALGHGPAGRDIYALTGNGHAFAAGRLAFSFGFQGPCLTVDTACSSSLVAVHLAVRCLRDGDSDLAVAGGVQLTLSATSGALLARSGALAPDGRCKTFDAAADGFTRGEGCGVVVLKRLRDARRDGDPVLAVIRGSATNQDGRSTGFTAPSVPAQAAMLRQALADADLAPDDIGFIETHGTGTAVGDPIELAALTAVFGARTTPLILGAVKTNLGHLEAAAGITGLIKTVLCLHRGVIPPNLHFVKPNPLAAGRFTFPTTPVPAPRRAGVSAFGMSGSNAHIILEAAPDDDAPPTTAASAAPPTPRPDPPPTAASAAPPTTTGAPATETSAPHLLLLSARSPAALAALATLTADHLRTTADPLRDLCFTAAVRRSHHPHRLALPVHDPATAARDLTAFAAGDPPAHLRHGLADARPRPVFVFSGQGSVWPGMARDLLGDPSARAALLACDEQFAPHLRTSIVDEMLAPAATSRLAATELAQPALFAVALALTAMLRARGVVPAAVLGHSVGEIAAAHVAGILDLADAARLVCLRGRVMQRAHGRGAMATVDLSPETAAPLLAAHPGVAIAAINGPRSLVLAGEPAALDAALADLTARGARTRRLRIDYAFHSPQMAALQPALRDLLGPHPTPRRADLRLYSTVTGAPADGPELGPEHWLRGLVQPVLFARAVDHALAADHRLFIEVGPHPTLLADLRALAPDAAVIPTLWRDRPAAPELLRVLAELHVAGQPLDLAALFPAPNRVVPLPTYPWQRRDHWLTDVAPVPTDSPTPPGPTATPPVPRDSLILPGQTATPPVPRDSLILPVQTATTPVPRDSLTTPGQTATTPVPQASLTPPVPPASPVLASLRRAAPEARRAALLRPVRAEVGAVLGLADGDPLPPRQGLFDLGLDSMTAVELRQRLAARFGVELAPTLVFDHPTIDGLAAHLADALAADAPEPIQPAAAPHDEPIAIVGLACRFPGGANDPAAYWDLLLRGADATSDVPADRWDMDAWHDPDPSAPGKIYARRSGFLQGQDVAEFDAAFFRITPAEARALDPQQRLLLELTWEALEHAGQSPDPLVGSRTGVYVGIATADYAQLAMQAGPAAMDPYVTTGTAANTAAGRISHFLGLRGPAIALDTACSSSLVALHLACTALRRGEVDLAVVGGVNLMLAPWIPVMYARMGTLAPDSRCKAFDAAADGMVRGEGGAVLLLKRLSAAERDGDRVHAVVRGSAINHDGRSGGLTVPSGAAQREVLRAALHAAGLAPASVTYVEAHGTGTSLGDPIEANALISELGRGRDPARPLHLGAVKANIGHLEAAAGLAGIIKTILALQHGLIPPQPHFTALNPAIAPAASTLHIPVTATPWPTDAPRIAGVSSFGMSGTNAHILLEAHPSTITTPAGTITAPAVTITAPAVTTTPPLILPISARTPAALRSLAAAWRTHLAEADPDLAATCAAAALRRAHLEHRLALTGADAPALRAALDAWLAGDLHPGWSHLATPGARPRLVFVFAGHSGHWPGMGRRLYADEPVFRAAIDACARALAAHRDGDLVADLTAADAEQRWRDTEVLQPVVLAVQLALADLWSAWGIVPTAVVGHSMGEIAAATVAGALTLDDAFRVCVARSRLLERLRGRGAMASVALPIDQLHVHLAAYAGRVAVAAANSPQLTILSGDPDAIRDLCDDLTRANIFARIVRDATTAGHSPQLDPLLPELTAALAGLTPTPTKIPFYSTVTADLLAGEALGPDYWRRNLRDPVRFTQTLQQLADAGHDAYLEISPTPLLLGAIEQTLRPRGGAITRLGSLKPHAPERLTLLTTLARLHAEGLDPDWTQVHPHGSRAAPLPTYPWQRQRHWLAAPPPQTRPSAARHTIAARPPHDHLWDHHVDPTAAATIHLQDLPLLPLAHPIIILLDAHHDLSPGTAIDLRDLTLAPPLHLDAEADLQLILDDPAGQARRFELLARRTPQPAPKDTPQQTIAPDPKDPQQTTSTAPAPKATHQQTTVPVPGDTHQQTTVPVPKDTFQQTTAPAPRDTLQPTSPPPQWTRRAAGRTAPATDGPPERTDLTAARARCHVPGRDPRAVLAARGLALPASLWPLERSTSAPQGAPRESLARTRPTLAAAPALLECALLQLVALAHPADAAPVDGELFLPRRIDRLWLAPDRSPVVWLHAALRGPVGASFGVVGDLQAFDAAGRLVASLTGVHLHPPDRDLARQAVARRLDRWLYDLRWQPAADRTPHHVRGTWLLVHGQPPTTNTSTPPVDITTTGASSPPVDITTTDASSPPVDITTTDASSPPVDITTTDASSPPVDIRTTGASSPPVDIRTTGASSPPLDPTSDLARTLADRLTARGDRCVHVHDLADLTAVLRDAGPVRGVLHLLAAPPAGRDLPERITAGALTLLHLVQTLAHAGARTRLHLVSRGAQPVGPGPLALAAGALWGMARTIPLEHPDLPVRLLDLDPSRPVDLDDLLNELDDTGPEDLVAHRDGARLAARLVRAAPPPVPAPLALRPDATYLISGGLGGVGLQLATWLVDRGARRLILLSRRGLPDLSPKPSDPNLSQQPSTPNLSQQPSDPNLSQQPSDLSQQPSDHDPTWEPREAIRRLTAAGARVDVIAADVADAQAIAAVLAGIQPSHPLRGVFHAAGVSDPRPLLTTSDADVRALLRPKIAGAWVLHSATRDLPLDHFVGFSSAAATWGAALLGPYSAANHFLDLLAHHRRAGGLPGLSVDWGGWSGGGMASADVQRYAADMGLIMTPAAHLLEALDILLQADVAQKTVADVDWQIFKPVLEARGPRPLLARIDVPRHVSGAGPVARQLATAALEARWDLLVAHIRERAAAVLGFTDPLSLARDQGFFQMGMDSVMSVRLRGELERSLGLALPPTLAFEQPSVDALAAWIAREHLAITPPAPSPAAPDETAALQHLSESDLAALLAAELDAP